mgnify:CR=1 FL=1
MKKWNYLYSVTRINRARANHIHHAYLRVDVRHVAAHDGFVLALHAVQGPAVNVPEQFISLQVHHRDEE